MQLEHLGWDPFFDRQLSAEERDKWTPARVMWEGRGAYRLSTGTDERQAVLAGRLRYRAESRASLPAVGDWVLASPSTIHRVLSRRTVFLRKAAGRATGEQVVAANIDTVLLVTSLNRDFNLRRLERYLALAWESGANPVVVINKTDLCGDSDARRFEAVPSAPGVPVVMTSAVQGTGLRHLAEIVHRGGTTALLGSSGVGKSTLINALLGQARQEVLEIREGDDRGRHSTTSRQMFLVPGGGVLVDTPGMRELQLWDAEDGLEHAFADIGELSAQCRFRDCLHDAEPGCAVTEAVAGGLLDAARLESYRRLQREEEYRQSRVEEVTPRERGRHARQMSKALKQIYKMRPKP